jgi:hypothetical protein
MSDTALIGKAKELYVATLLVARKLHVYFPLVDNGFDLIATSPDASRFLPIQVKYKAERSGFALKRTDADRFGAVDAVLAFGSEKADEDSFYFFPGREWLKIATAQDRGRGDEKLVVYLAESREWAEEFRGHAGIDRAFASLLRHG